MPSDSHDQANQKRTSAALLPLVALIYGTCSLSAQIIFLRQFYILSIGSELTLGIVLGVYLLAGALGSFFAARFFCAKNRAPRALRWTLGTLGVLFPLSLFLLAYAKAALGIMPAQIPSFHHIFFMLLATLAPFSFVSGMFFPLAVSTLGREDEGRRSAIVYLAEAVGSCLGALFFSLWVIPVLAPMDAALVLSVLLFACGAFLSHKKKASIFERFGLLFWLILMLGTASLGLFGNLAHRHSSIYWQPMEFMAGRSSHPAYLEAVAIGDQVSLYENGLLIATAGYHAPAIGPVRMAMKLRPHAKKALVIGGYLSGFAAKLKPYGLARVDCVEFNPSLIPFARENFPAPSFSFEKEPGLSLISSDERVFLGQASPVYDLIFINKGLPTSLALNRFFTREFMEELAGALKPDGLAVLEIPASSHYLTEEQIRFLACLKKTVDSAFPHVEMYAGNTVLLLMGKNPGAAAAAPGKKSRGMLARTYSRKAGIRLAELLDKEAEGVEVNTDLHPVGYMLGLAERLGSLHNPLQPLANVPQKFSIILACLFPVLLVALPVLLGRAFGVRRPPVHATAFLLGFTSLSFVVCLLFAFQVRFGYLFFKLGILLALFMGGLALGSAVYVLQERRAGNSILTRMPVVLWLIGLLLLSAGLVSFWKIPSVGYDVFSIVGGFVFGYAFPLLVAHAASRNPAKISGHVSGTIYALDMAGAAIGAAVTGPLLLAFFGLPATFAWISAFFLVAGLCWFPFQKGFNRV